MSLAKDTYKLSVAGKGVANRDVFQPTESNGCS